MKIETKTTHVLTFAVEAFWNEEGGMGSDSFGDTYSDLPAAIHALELARAAEVKRNKHDVQRDWIITIDVKTTQA